MHDGKEFHYPDISECLLSEQTLDKTKSWWRCHPATLAPNSMMREILKKYWLLCSF